MIFKTRKMRDIAIAYKRVFDSEEGKKVLKDLMRSCFMLDTTYTNKEDLIFNEGARSVVLRILKTTETDIEALDKYIDQIEIENKEEQYE